MQWDPVRYLAFADHRLRPAVDLLNRVPLAAPATVYDLGCGPGNVTRLLAERWPAAAVVGVDSSPDMLARAAREQPALTFQLADVAGWQPPQPADLIFSNAALHWLDGHEMLLPRLLDALTPGGWLAVQMPRNHQAPSHTEMVAVAEGGPWAARLRPLLRTRPVAPPGAYYDILRPHAAELEIWDSEYLQVLHGDDPVVAWTSGTALRPLLQALDESERQAFLADYGARMRAAYPRRADGATLFPFRRLFLVAKAN